MQFLKNNVFLSILVVSALVCLSALLVFGSKNSVSHSRADNLLDLQKTVVSDKSKTKKSANNFSQLSIKQELVESLDSSLSSHEFEYSREFSLKASKKSAHSALADDFKVAVQKGSLKQKKDLSFKLLSAASIKLFDVKDRKVLGAVDCGPDGTTFEKPIKITMPLVATLVPGTPVEIGLLNPKTNNIDIQSIKSSINADGRSITFAVNHFSTYVALQNLVSKGAPIGGGVEIPMPDLATGAFSHAYPITVVPGRKSMQPSLVVRYKSGNGNSHLGVGFDMNPGFIARSTKNGVPAYNDNDTFIFINDGGATELVFLANGENGEKVYQAKIESAFSKFYKTANDDWRIIDKSGNLTYFGQSTNSKELGNGGTFKWFLTKVQDTNGNYMDYSYILDQGKSYLDKIDYTAHISNASVGPANRLEFIYETRTDIRSSYISGSKITSAKKLKTITVSTDKIPTDQNPVWEYTFDYTTSPKTKRTLLQKITQCGKTECLPAQEFRYQ